MLVFNSLGILQISRAEPHFHQVPCGCWTKNRGVKPPKWMVKIMENPIKNGWFGGKTHHLKKTPMWNFQGFPRPLSVSIPRSSIGVNCSVASMTSPTATRLINGGHATGWDGTTIEVVGSTKRPMMGPVMESAGIPKKNMLFFLFGLRGKGGIVCFYRLLSSSCWWCESKVC